MLSVFSVEQVFASGACLGLPEATVQNCPLNIELDLLMDIIGNCPLDSGENTQHLRDMKDMELMGVNVNAMVDETSIDDRLNGLRPLHLAAHLNNVDALNLLLKMKANIDLTDKWKQTALIRSVMAQSFLAAFCLMKKGANVKMQDSQGNTALHWAASHKHEATVKLLLDCGADAKICNLNGVPAIQIAKKSGESISVAKKAKPLIFIKKDSELDDAEVSRMFFGY